MSSLRQPAVLFLLDWEPRSWSTREEYFLRVAEQLQGWGAYAVIVPSRMDSEDIRGRYYRAGASIKPKSYLDGAWQYWRHLRCLRRRHNICAVQVRFFDYFSAVPWLCWFAGIRPVFFTEANGGEWNGTGWRRLAIRARTMLMGFPIRRVVGISEFVKRRLVSVGFSEKRISVIYNGIDLETFRPSDRQARSEMGAADSTIVMLFAGSMLPIKRPVVALRVCAELAKGVDVQLWMAGDGGMRADLQREFEGLPVKWLGHHSNPQRLMAGADVLLHTTLGEAFGNVFVEAMACGLPVVASDSGAASEVVPVGAGVLVATGASEVTGLVQAVLRVVADRERFARGALEASRRFPLSLVTEATMRIYGPHIPEFVLPE